MKKQRKGILLTVILCSLLFAATYVTASAAIINEQPIDESNATIKIEQGHEYGSDEGYKLRITSEDLTEGELVYNDEKYELGKEYTLPTNPFVMLEFYDNYEQLDPYDHFVYGEKKYSFHILSKWTPPVYDPAPTQGEWMSYGYKIELVPAKMPVDVVFSGETTVSCYVGDNIMSNHGITVDDNGEDITDMLSGEKVDTSKASKVTYYWYVTGKSGNQVTFKRVFDISEKPSPTQPATTQPTVTDKPAATPKTVMISTTALVKGTGSVSIAGSGKCYKKKGKLWIKTAKGKKVTLKAKGKKFKYWQKKVGKKYKKYSKKKTIKVKASKNTVYRAVFKK